MYPALSSGLGIIFFLLSFRPLISALGCACYFDMTHSGPVSRVRMKSLASRKVLLRPMEEVHGNSQRDESGCQCKRTQEDDHFGDWQILGLALSHVFVYFHQSFPRPVVIFLVSAMFLSFFEGRKIIYILELSWEISLLPFLAWKALKKAMTVIFDGFADNLPLLCCGGLTLFDQVIRSHIMSSRDFWRTTTEDATWSFKRSFLFQDTRGKKLNWVQIHNQPQTIRWPWASYITCLSLSFLFSKMRALD